MAIRDFWKYMFGKAKTVVQNYNVIERAEKLLEKEKRPAPRHPGTESKFNVLIKSNPGVEAEMEKNSSELLDRLKIVKVTSEGEQEDLKTTKSLPQFRGHVPVPTYGYEEPKSVPEGKCSLKQALDFIAVYQKDSESHSAESLSDTYKLKPKDVMDILTHFRVFEVYISREGDMDSSAEQTMKDLGIKKVVRPVMKAKFAQFESKSAEALIKDKKNNN